MIKFTADFILPEMLLSILPLNEEKKRNRYGKHRFSAKSAEYMFLFEYSDINPVPEIIDNSDSVTIIFGAPVIEDKINIEQSVKFAIKDNEVNRSNLHKINGEFLIIHFNKKNSELSIINDRYTSIPLFYTYDKTDKSFTASVYFSSIWKYLADTGKQKLNQNALFEFLWFQRLFGTKTYDTNTFFLADSSILNLNNNKITISHYWQRNYQKNSNSLNQNAQSLAALVRQSVKRKSSDNQRFGHFLSGGMDSRTVLCGFDEPPVCFTSTISENREFRKAAEIADAKGAKHIGLELDPEHFAKIFRHSTNVIGGMYNYDHGLFYGFNKAVREHADVCFHGHGFDYMFQGMYIPGNDVVIRGRHLYLRFMKDLPEDLVPYFINNASYRIKNADIWKYINDNHKKSLKEFQHTSINDILSKGKELTNNLNDLWEYLTFHHISRHYSYPNHASIATFAEQRTVSFDNDLFNLYLSTPHSHRFNGKIEKKALKILNPEIAAIWNANTNLPVTASCWKQTAYQLMTFIKHRFVPEKQVPAWKERTWPSRSDALKNQKSLKEAVLSLSASKKLENLDFLDISKLHSDIKQWMSGENIPGISGDFLQTLLTMGTFLEQ
jgi:asparagine synthetase B (glutamine-hydrolysing)